LVNVYPHGFSFVTVFCDRNAKLSDRVSKLLEAAGCFQKTR